MKRPQSSLRNASTLLLAGLAVFATTTVGAEEKLVDGVAAQVGNDIVLVSEVYELAAPMEERMREAGAPEAQVAALRAEALERLIEGRLITAMVRRLELTATKEEVDGAIRGIAAETGLTMRQLAESVSSHGLTFDEYREKIAGEIERNKVLNALVRSQIRIEPEEVEALFEQRYAKQHSGGEEIHLLHLVVAYGAAVMRDRETACGLATEGARRIASGEFSFEDVARRISDANPQTGGDMGWVHETDLAVWMIPVVRKLQPGELSSVVETSFGCNLFLLKDRRTFEAATLESARAELENELYAQKTEQRYIEWVNELRGQSYIERKGVFAIARSGAPQ